MTRRPQETVGSAQKRTGPATAVLAWYDVHARDLPWRRPPDPTGRAPAPDPYRVWLSEIMLQQTTVAAVTAYFKAFTERWPTIETLAAADETDITAAWAGLGYYSRARNLHACARMVADEHGGRFPESAAELKRLPGIGDYTSAAIAAIAFNEPAPVVDGNIERVVTRLFRIGDPLPSAKPLVRAKVAELTPKERPGDFAQAMMDIGATICVPRRPACLLCPLRPDCEAEKAGDQTAYPVKAAKKAKPQRRGAAYAAFDKSGRHVWLRRRVSKGMLGGMVEVPSSEWSSRGDGATGPDGAPFSASWRKVGEVEHGFTHFDLTLEVFAAVIDGAPKSDGWWAKIDDLVTEGLPTLMRKAMDLAIASQKQPK